MEKPPMLTVTPGSMVNFAPTATVTGPVSVYGLPEAVQVVSVEITCSGTSVSACTLLTMVNPLSKKAIINNAVEIFFKFLPQLATSIYGNINFYQNYC
jgi:hypothetical protein